MSGDVRFRTRSARRWSARVGRWTRRVPSSIPWQGGGSSWRTGEEAQHSDPRARRLSFEEEEEDNDARGEAGGKGRATTRRARRSCVWDRASGARLGLSFLVPLSTAVLLPPSSSPRGPRARPPRLLSPASDPLPFLLPLCFPLLPPPLQLPAQLASTWEGDIPDSTAGEEGEGGTCTRQRASQEEEDAARGRGEGGRARGTARAAAGGRARGSREIGRAHV